MHPIEADPTEVDPIEVDPNRSWPHGGEPPLRWTCTEADPIEVDPTEVDLCHNQLSEVNQKIAWEIKWPCQLSSANFGKENRGIKPFLSSCLLAW